MFGMVDPTTPAEVAQAAASGVWDAVVPVLVPLVGGLIGFSALFWAARLALRRLGMGGTVVSLDEQYAADERRLEEWAEHGDGGSMYFTMKGEGYWKCPDCGLMTRESHMDVHQCPQDADF